MEGRDHTRDIPGTVEHLGERRSLGSFQSVGVDVIEDRRGSHGTRIEVDLDALTDGSSARTGAYTCSALTGDAMSSVLCNPWRVDERFLRTSRAKSNNSIVRTTQISTAHHY